MHFSFAIIAVLGTVAIAAPAPLERRNATGPSIGPFALHITSDITEWNNTYVQGYHVGAAIDKAVASHDNDLDFFLNNTYVKDGETYGSLAYPISPNIPFVGSVSPSSDDNISWFMFYPDGPDNTARFKFDANGYLQLEDDGSWQGCVINTFDGLSTIIAWKSGKASPSNKTCVPIQISKSVTPPVQPEPISADDPTDSETPTDSDSPAANQAERRV